MAICPIIARFITAVCARWMTWRVNLRAQLARTSLRYQYTTTDHHSLGPLYGRTFEQTPMKHILSESLRIVDYESF